MYKLALLYIFTIFIFTGCGSADYTVQAEEVKDLALNYLIENYDDSFSACGYIDSDLMYEYKTVTFVSERFSEVVEVRVFEENDHYYFVDNYFRLRMQDDAKEYMKRLASIYNMDTEVNIRFISSRLPDSLGNDASFYDYVATEKCNLEVYFISDNYFSADAIDSILKELCSQRIKGFITFVVCEDTKFLSQYHLDDILEERYNSILSWQRYTIDSNFSVSIQK